jgi:hypothetical protein
MQFHFGTASFCFDEIGTVSANEADSSLIP